MVLTKDRKLLWMLLPRLFDPPPKDSVDSSCDEFDADSADLDPARRFAPERSFVGSSKAVVVVTRRGVGDLERDRVARRILRAIEGVFDPVDDGRRSFWGVAGK